MKKKVEVLPDWLNSVLPAGAVLIACILGIAFLLKIETKKKKKELILKADELKTCEEKFCDIYNATTDAIFIHDPSTGKILDINQAALEMYGYSRDEFLQMTIDDISSEKFAYMMKQAMVRIKKASSDAPQIFEWRSIKKSGEVFWVEVVLKSTVIDNNNRLIAAVRDIDQRKQAEEKLAAEKERLSAILTSVTEGVIATDARGKIILINKAAETMTGWPIADALGKRLHEVFCIINENNRESADNTVEKAKKAIQILGSTDRKVLVSRNKKKYRISKSIAPLKDKGRKIQGVVHVFRDVTAQLKAEEEIFNARKLESVGVLAGGIAHDFNNILTGISGNIFLAKTKLKQEGKAYAHLDIVEKALERATNLSKQLLTFAKGGEPILEMVNIQQVIYDSARFNLSGRNVKAHFNLPNDLWQVKADKIQISQVFGNLIINAFQAMPDGGNIYIDAENSNNPKDDRAPELYGKYVKINLRDEGFGISSKYIEKIFDPYFSTKNTGSGLGLATVYSIISKHNGHISVESDSDSGTTFTIYLPTSKYSEKTADAIRSGAGAGPAPASGNILVMDDDELVRNVSGKMLQSFGYMVDFAVDGREAIEKYMSAIKSDNPFLIVIMDLTVPGGIGGKKAVEKLLAVDPDAKVIVASGYSTDPIIANYSEYGFKGRIVKPFQVKQMKAEIRRVMEMA